MKEEVGIHERVEGNAFARFEDAVNNAIAELTNTKGLECEDIPDEAYKYMERAIQGLCSAVHEAATTKILLATKIVN